MTASLQTLRTTVKRLPKRGAYDRATIEAIIDEALICHVGFVIDGQPAVIPTIHWRAGETLYFHGSTASRMLRSLKNGVDACVTITLLDGLVLARSAFHHSMNYRSVVVFGTAREVTDPAERLTALDSLVEHVCAGRSKDVRPPNDRELAQTLVLALPLTEARLDDDEDYALPYWAGVIPLRIVAQPPEADERLSEGIATPAYAVGYGRPTAPRSEPA